MELENKTLTHSQPTISVIMPAYNAEQTIRRQLDAILQQSFQNFELIVVDDGSMDHTLDIIRQYARKNRRVVPLSIIHKGVSAARNAGLDQARGKYLAFADADDWVDTEWLQTFMNQIGDSDCCDQTILAHTHQGISSLGYPKGIIRNETEKQEYIYHISGYLFRYLLRRSLVEEFHIRFKEDLSLQEDLIFYLEYTLHAKTINCIIGDHYHYYEPDYKNKYAGAFFQSIRYRILILYQKYGNRFELRKQDIYFLRGILIQDILQKRYSDPIMIESFERLRTDIESHQFHKIAMNNFLLIAAKGNVFARLLFIIYNRIWQTYRTLAL